MTISAPHSRSVLFLQGISSPLFWQLGRALVSCGAQVHRINICAGDFLFWPQRGAYNYRGRFSGWARYLKTVLDTNGITDIVLFGRDRPYHRVAVMLARRRNIVIHAFDEGLMRPSWITMQSGYADDKELTVDQIVVRARSFPQPSRPRYAAGGFTRRALWDIGFHVTNLTLGFTFPCYIRHRPLHPLVEAFGWLRKAIGWRAKQLRAEQEVARLADGEAPYFLLPLQLDSDYQIRRRSPYSGMGEVMEQVFASFARHAPPDCLLVVKAHPLDNGVINRGKQVSTIAERFGLAGRVCFVDGGHLPTLIRSAHGVVIVNSTTGLTALQLNKPTFALAHPIFKLPGLTSDQSLAQFWHHPQPPNSDLLAAFEVVIANQTQINGSYFNSEGIAMAVQAILPRFCQDVSASERTTGELA